MENREKGSTLAESTEMKKYPPLDPSKLKVNPFAQELSIPATRLNETGKYVRDPEGIMLPSSALIEKRKYTRVYHGAAIRNILMMLSPAATKLLWWMTMEIGEDGLGGKDWVRVVPETYASKAGKGASKTQYKVAVDELMTEGLIVGTIYKYTYWLNPAVLFKGNPIEQYPDRVVVGSEEISTVDIGKKKNKTK